MQANGSPTKNQPDTGTPSGTSSQPQIQESRPFRLQICHKPLRTNPYTAYRDETGRWIVVRH
jgi:hypothetical protein